MSFGDKLREQRLACHMTMESLAILVGTSRQTIQRYESGRIACPPYERIEALAAALGTTPGELMGWQSTDDRNAAYGGMDDTSLPFVTAPDDAMEGDRILERDRVYFQNQNHIEDGQIAVVEMNDQKIIRRVWRNGESLVLLASNPTYPPLVVQADSLEVRMLGAAVFLKTLL